jgi:hypothetical protein
MSGDDEPRPAGFATLDEALAAIAEHERPKQHGAFIILWMQNTPPSKRQLS